MIFTNICIKGNKMENLKLLVDELRQLPSETPWLEFKHNNYDPQMIGQDICALANAATLYENTSRFVYIRNSAYSARTAHPFQRNGAPFRFKLSKAQQVD